MPKYTPGPWVAGFSHQHAFRVYAGSLDGPIVANCNCEGGVATGVEAAANSDLIASAPDLEEALDWALDIIDMYDEALARRDGHERVYTDIHIRGKAKARTALAKARGEQ